MQYELQPSAGCNMNFSLRPDIYELQLSAGYLWTSAFGRISMNFSFWPDDMCISVLYIIYNHNNLYPYISISGFRYIYMEYIYLPTSALGRMLQISSVGSVKKCTSSNLVLPRSELGFRDSKSQVLTITPEARSQFLTFFTIHAHHKINLRIDGKPTKHIGKFTKKLETFTSMCLVRPSLFTWEVYGFASYLLE
jgi:hypothetical protein